MEEESNLPLYLNRITRWDDTSWAASYPDILVEHLGRFREPKPPRPLAKALSGCSYATVPPEALSVVTGRLPIEDPQGASELDEFIRDSVTVAAPHTAYAATLLLRTVNRYVIWCVRNQGWPLDGRIIWSVRGIDLYTTTANLDRSPGTRANYRALLMRVSEILLPDEHPDRTTPLAGRKTAAPYTAEEMLTFREWAGRQLTDVKLDRAMLMLTLCAGAGLRPSELPLVHPHHITVDEHGILVHIPTDTPRDVPLLAEWEEWMNALLERRPADESLWGKVNRRNTHNLTSAFTESSNGHPPRADRLRATWLAHHLTAGAPLKDLFRAAGIAKFQHLHLLLEHIGLMPDTDYRRAFRSGGRA
jgi:integrase